jgi:hypothetical protein
MVAFMEEHRAAYEVESICRVLAIAPATYYERVAERRDPSRQSTRRPRDAELRKAIQRVWDTNFRVCGPRKVWQELQRQGRSVARCTAERLTCAKGLLAAAGRG